jgi:CRISPR-associated protein Csx10
MKKIKLSIELLSDTCLGSGAGLAGLVDQDLLYDSLGFPMVNGKTVKGWLVEACADIMAGLGDSTTNKLKESANRLFGNPGDAMDETLLFIGDAHFPDEIRKQEVLDLQELKNSLDELMTADQDDLKHRSIISHYNKQVNFVKESYSRIRYQTAIEDTGVAKDGSLRTIRVINRGNTLVSDLQYFGSKEDEQNDFVLLCAVVACVRRIGLNRTRGLGRVKCELSMAGKSDFFKENLEGFANGLRRDDEDYESN